MTTWCYQFGNLYDFKVLLKLALPKNLRIKTKKQKPLQKNK